MFAEEERGQECILEKCCLYVFNGLHTFCNIYKIKCLKRFNLERKCRMMVCFQTIKSAV